ncbi:MAG: hypothetical protein AAF519_03400 [Bacteroidota bacterium]
MKKYLQLKMLVVLWALAIFTLSCGDDDDEVTIFDAPSIAVVVDNSAPFQGDEITFSITVSAEGGLSSVSLNSQVIKQYSDETTEDTFDHMVVIEEGATTGPTSFEFTVEDTQLEVKSGAFPVSITIQNSDLRGTPVLLTDFQDAIPNSDIEAITFDSGPNPWEGAYSEVDGQAEDPTNPANLVLKANRLSAHEWFFQGGGAVFLQYADFISEEEIQAIVDGNRVLQMNLYFQENVKMQEVHTDPNDVDNNRLMADLSYTFNSLAAENYTNDDGVVNNGLFRGWNFDQQDSVTGISVRLEIGNAATWDFNDGDPLGKKFFLVGTITKPNEWETVTFSPLFNSGTSDEPDLIPRTTGDANLTFLDDANIGIDAIDYMAIILNNRRTRYDNPDGFFEVPGDGNGNQSNVIAGITDDHNTYFIDNIRVIDADVFDQNPNN